MTVAGVIAAITALGTIVTGLVYLIKRIFPPTSPAATDAQITESEATNETNTENSGRPS